MAARRASGRVLGLSAALLAVAGGCAHEAGTAAKEAAQQAVPPAIGGSLQTLNAPENKRIVGELLTAPEIADAEHLFAHELATGIVDGLTEDEAQARFRTIAGQFGAGLARGFTRSLSDGTEAQMGPALRRVLGEQVGPGLGEMLSDEKLGRGLEQASRQLSRGFILGMDDAFGELDAKQQHGQKTILERLGGTAKQGLEWTTVLVSGLGLVVVVLGLLLARLTIHTRREQAEMQRRQVALTSLVAALRSAETKSWGPELQEILRTQTHDAAALRDLLHGEEHPPH